MEPKWSGLWLLISAVTLIMVAHTTNAEPLGANVSVLNISRRVDFGPAGSVGAQAGNVTALNIEAGAITKYWQGYYGNVSGTIALGNAAGSNLYTWASASPRGEIFASRNNSRINWTGVRCASQGQVINEDGFIGAHPGETVDSVNRTFNYTSHPSLFLSNRTISGCPSVSVGGTGNGNIFWEALLADNGTSTQAHDDIFLYTGIIDPDQIGFTGGAYDFQMLVGEPGNGTEEFPSGTATTYYFYLELS